MAECAVFYPFGKVILKNADATFIGLAINLSPKAVYADPQGILDHLFPAMFMISDGGKQRHCFLGLFARGVGIETLSCKRFASRRFTTQKGHRDHEVDMEGNQTRFRFWRIPM